MPVTNKYLLALSLVLAVIFSIAGVWLVEVIHNKQAVILVTILGLYGVTLALMLAVWRALSAPLDKLANKSQKLLRNENAEHFIPSSSNDLQDISRALQLVEYHKQDVERHELLEEQKIASLLNSMLEGVIAVDHNQDILHINQAALKILNASDKNVIGKPIWQVSRIRELSSLLNKTLKSASTHTATILHRNAYEHCIALKSAPLIQDSKQTGAVIVLNDVTKDQQLDNMRKNFVTNASHELKTPIMAIRSIIETILDDENMSHDIQKRFLQKINMQCSRISDLVKQLLLLSKTEGLSISSYKEQVSLENVLSFLGKQYTAIAEIKDVQFSLPKIDKDIFIHGNSELLLQAIGNLVDNALKYTPEGGKVDVEYYLESKGIVIRVTDTGIGIAKSEQARIFERFYRVDKAHNSTVEGSGLGLAIVKHIITAHGGSIDVSSQLGEGSVFSVKLPIISGV